MPETRLRLVHRNTHARPTHALSKRKPICSTSPNTSPVSRLISDDAPAPSMLIEQLQVLAFTHPNLVAAIKDVVRTHLENAEPNPYARAPKPAAGQTLGTRRTDIPPRF